MMEFGGQGRKRNHPHADFQPAPIRASPRHNPGTLNRTIQRAARPITAPAISLRLHASGTSRADKSQNRKGDRSD